MKLYPSAPLEPNTDSACSDCFAAGTVDREHKR